MRNIVYSKPILALLTIVAIFSIYVVWGAYQKEYDTRERWGGRAAVLDELKDRESGLQLEINRLETEKGIEAEIRSKFEVARSGENVIVIVEPPEEEATVIPEKKSLWRRIFGL